MAERVNRQPTWPGYSDPSVSDWPRPLRLMALTAKRRWRANRPDAIALLVALSDLRRMASIRAGQGAATN